MHPVAGSRGAATGTLHYLGGGEGGGSGGGGGGFGQQSGWEVNRRDCVFPESAEQEHGFLVVSQKVGCP